MKRVIAKLLLNEAASLELFQQYTADVIAESRAEDGNIAYDLYQDTSQSTSFLFLELYRDQEALDKHFGSGHLGAFLSKVTPLLKNEPEVIIDELA
ncbi:putative quinol monooxygenase [Mucilaginibacter sp. HD30]